MEKQLYEQFLPHEIRRKIDLWEPRHGQHVSYFNQNTDTWDFAVVHLFDREKQQYELLVRENTGHCKIISVYYENMRPRTTPQ